MRSTPLVMGEPVPWFYCRTSSRERFAFDTVAGRYIVLAFFGSAADAKAAELLRRIASGRKRFNDVDLCFFGVSVDREDEKQHRVTDSIPGIRYFWDFDRAVSARYGAVLAEGGYRPITYVLDPALRVLAAFTHSATAGDSIASLFALLDRLPRIPPTQLIAAQAPVLILPRVFETSLCEALIDYYEAHGGDDSGFMCDVDGKTTTLIDYDHKRRRDCTIEDEELRRVCMVRVHVPARARDPQGIPVSRHAHGALHRRVL